MSNPSNPTRFTLAALLGGAVAAVIITLATLSTGMHFGSRDTINQAAAPDSIALAQAVAKLDEAPEILPDEVASIIEALRQRAREGDVEAARFVVELARRQNAATAADESGRIEPAPAASR